MFERPREQKSISRQEQGWPDIEYLEVTAIIDYENTLNFKIYDAD